MHFTIAKRSLLTTRVKRSLLTSLLLNRSLQTTRAKRSLLTSLLLNLLIRFRELLKYLIRIFRCDLFSRPNNEPVAQFY